MKRTPRSARRRASRQLAAKRAGPARIGTVELERARRLFRDIGQLRHRALHPVRHLVLRDARGDLRIAELLEFHPVQLGQIVDEPPPFALR